ncbi:MAG: helix-turn-helix transcriptional regulator [Candidatus Aminicenantia bacterium]
MNRLSNVEIAILGLVAEKPRYGYEIEAVIEERGMREWTDIGFSSIYYVLSKLEKEGLLESKIEQRGSTPFRRIYRINKKGKETLKKEIVRLISNPKKTHSELDLGISNLPCLSKKEVIISLKKYIESLIQRKKHVEETFKRQEGEKLPFFVQALFIHSLSHIETEIRWVNEFIEIVNQKYKKGGKIMKKLDLTKEYKTYYIAKTVPEIVEFSEGHFLTIEGKGAPAGREFMAKMKALYTLAYGIKMAMKKEGKDFTVTKLEGLWWVDSDKPYLEVPREEWQWKLLIRQPEFIISEIVERAKSKVIKKKGIEFVKDIKLEKITEGKCVQILHIGPYSTESESWEKMRKLMEEKNLVENGLHHEIYLTDPRRVPEEKYRTILRQPVKSR